MARREYGTGSYSERERSGRTRYVACIMVPDARGGKRRAEVWGADFLRDDVYPLMALAGLRRVTFHALRHSGNTAIADRFPMVNLMYRLGHSNERMTRRYTHNTREIAAVAVRALDDIFPMSLAGEHWGEDWGTPALATAVGESGDVQNPNRRRKMARASRGMKRTDDKREQGTLF